MAADDISRSLTRTALAWRRTALSLLGLCLVSLKLIDWAGGLAGAFIGFASLAAAAAVVGYAEQGVRQLTTSAPRPVFELLSATASVISILAIAGLVLAISA